LRKSSARSARESASVSFWQTRQRSCSVKFFMRAAICGSSLGCASLAKESSDEKKRRQNSIAKILSRWICSLCLRGSLCLCGELRRERSHRDTELSQRRRGKTLS